MQEKCPGLGERGTADLCSCVHCPLEGLAVCCTTVPVPDSDTAGQHTLNGSPVESGEDGGGKLALFSRWRKCRHCCAFLESDDGKLDDVVGAEFGSVVMGQQREEQRAEHTALWGTSAQCGNARGVVADTD